MSKPNLRELLHQLHDEIDKAEPVDDKSRALLNELDGRVHELMHRAEQEGWKAEPSAITGLKDAVLHFEVSHPNLTAAIARLLDT